MSTVAQTAAARSPSTGTNASKRVATARGVPMGSGTGRSRRFSATSEPMRWSGR